MAEAVATNVRRENEGLLSLRDKNNTPVKGSDDGLRRHYVAQSQELSKSLPKTIRFNACQQETLKS